MEIGEKARAKLSKFGRLDLAIANVKRIDNRSVKIAFNFLENLGNPTKSEISDFFKIHLAEFTPNLDSCYRTKDAVFVLASLTPVTRNAADNAKMKTVIAGLKFLDSELGNVWELKKDGDTQVLQQVIHLDVSELVKDRAKKMNRVSAQIEVTSNVANLAVGDHVLAWFENKKYEGVVQNITLPRVTLNVSGNPMVLDIQAVYKIVEKAPGKEKQQQEKLNDYFSKVFGPSYSRNLVK